MPRRKLPWDRVLLEAEARFGVDALWPGQRELIEAVLAGKDALGVLPTGGGKSLCFQLPAVVLPGAVVVVSPLIALMKDQAEKMTEAEVDVAALDSTLAAREERDVEARLAEGELDLVYVTPERLERAEEVELLRARGVALFVVDEAHCVSQWGHDFRPAYLGLRDAIAALGRPPVLALTATATPEVAADVVAQLAMRDPVIVRASVDRPNLRLEVARCDRAGAKQIAFAGLLADEPGPGIVYCATVRTAAEVHAWLTDRGERAGLYHAKLAARARTEAQDRFMAGDTRVMVATKAFGMGIDKQDLRFVAHWQFPDSLESYVQEAGRAGRDGAPARAFLLFRKADRGVQSWFLTGRYPGKGECAAFYEAVQRAGAAPLGAIAELAGVKPRRAKVIAALLEQMGIVTRGRGAVRAARAFADGDELAAFLSSYEQRHARDRHRLDEMIRYAQTSLCRGQRVQRYFGEADAPPCGHCDNCISGAAARVIAEAQPPTTSPPVAGRITPVM